MGDDFRVPHAVKKFCTVHRPEDAEPPILPNELREVVHQWMIELGAVKELEVVGIKPRRSAILNGPPGCGKTTLAHHLAARLGLPLLAVNSDALISMYLGATGNNIAELFEALQGQEDRCILFLDEFDALASKRANVTGSAGERDANAAVSALLVRIEEFGGIAMAATNRADTIDPAMWRRFGIHLEIPLPGNDQRFAILKRYLLPLELPDEALDVLVYATSGAAPSLLRQMMEGVKRDLVLGPRLKRNTDAESVFRRLLVSVKPHPDYGSVPLWEDANVRKRVFGMAWPPVQPGASAA